MAIVRGDKRQSAIEAVADMRRQMGDTLLRIDDLQASLDDLEYSLGLASEGEIEGRDRHAVVHFGKGETVGHSLDTCREKGCDDTAADEVIENLATDHVSTTNTEEETP